MLWGQTLEAALGSSEGTKRVGVGAGQAGPTAQSEIDFILLNVAALNSTIY